MIDELKSTCNLDLNIMYTEDKALIGRIEQFSKASLIILKAGLSIFYDIETSRSRLFCPTVDQYYNWSPKYPWIRVRYERHCRALFSATDIVPKS